MSVELFKRIVIEEAKKNKDIYFVYVDGALTTLLDDFKKEFPTRVVNVGIAECEAISIASGLAMRGKRVYVIGLAQYMSARAYEQVRMDCAYNNANVKIVSYISGLSSTKAGYSHWAIEDLNLMSNLPNMTVTCPGAEVELQKVLEYSLSYDGPLYISWNCATYSSEPYHADIRKISEIYSGNDFALITYGADIAHSIEFCKKCIEHKIQPTLLSAHTLKPLDEAKIEEILKRNIPVITLEEHLYNGSLASNVARIIAQKGYRVPFLPIYIKDHKFNILGNRDFLREELMTHQDINNTILKFVSSNINPNKRSIFKKKYFYDKKKRLTVKYSFLFITFLLERKRLKPQKGKNPYKRLLFGFIPIS